LRRKPNHIGFCPGGFSDFVLRRECRNVALATSPGCFAPDDALGIVADCPVGRAEQPRASDVIVNCFDQLFGGLMRFESNYDQGDLIELNFALGEVRYA
jgi:hypothetical protein